MKGTLHKTENGWVVEYKKSIKLDDDEAQYEGKRYVFNKEYLPLHPEYEKYYFLDWDAEGAEVEFEMEDFWETGLERVITVAKLKKPNSSSKIVELQDGVNLEEIPKEQLEKERNPAYEYFDPIKQVANNIENPYELIWYKQGWSQKRVEKNNAKYWEWEIKYNNFVPPNKKNK